MQNRMRTHPLTDLQISDLLSRAAAGSLATLNHDGSPYVTPVHFVYIDGAIYFHGLPVGQKLSNIKNDPRVSLTVYEMEALLLDPDGKPCDTNTKYQSVIIGGKASIIDDTMLKRSILSHIVAKYTPDIAENDLPENMVKGTAVIKITIDEITGKYYS